MKADEQRAGSPWRARLCGRLAGAACPLLASLGLGLALVLFPPAAIAQEGTSAQAGVVKITGLREGTPVQGSGFVVSLDHDKAVIVTASHVIEGLQPIEVAFAADPSERFPAEVLGAEFGNSRGLAALLVHGALPTGIIPVAFEAEAQPEPGEDLIVVGFPNRQARTPLTLRRDFAGLDGNFLQLDRPSGEGCSGAPVLRRGRVVGMVVDEDPQLTFAVSAVVARAAVLGWKLKLEGTSAASTTPTAPASGPAVAPCNPGEERTENHIVYVRICPGTFTMGSAAQDSKADSNEKPAHLVKLGEFWIGKTEITNSQFQRFRPGSEGEANLPATGVTWSDAKTACEHFGGRLPKEAEWEYAARAGGQKAWSFGDDEKQLGEYAWFDEISGYKAHPVGLRKANAWGLYDMHGNVWEWVSDWFGPYKSGELQVDPGGSAAGPGRVIRGGSFLARPGDLRSAARGSYMPEDADKSIGFRCVLNSPPAVIPARL